MYSAIVLSQCGQCKILNLEFPAFCHLLNWTIEKKKMIAFWLYLHGEAEVDLTSFFKKNAELLVK